MSSGKNIVYRLMSVKQYADLRNRSPFTIRRWIKSKKIKATRLAAGHEWEIEVSEKEYERYRKH